MLKIKEIKFDELKKPIMSMLKAYLMQVKSLEGVRGIPKDLHFLPIRNVMYVSKNDEYKNVLYDFCKEVNIPYYKMDFKGKNENQIKIERIELFNNQDGCQFNTNEDIKFDLDNPKDDFQKAGILFCDNFNEMSGNWQYMFTFHNRVATFGSTKDGGYEGIFQFPLYWLYVAFASDLKDINGNVIPSRILDDFFIYDDNGEHYEE